MRGLSGRPGLHRIAIDNAWRCFSIFDVGVVGKVFAGRSNEIVAGTRIGGNLDSRSAGDSWHCAGLQLHSCGYAFVLDDRLPIPSDSVLTAKDLIVFVRTQMKRSISHAHTSGGETLGVYVLEIAR
jgi:hypothetical protein